MYELEMEGSVLAAISNITARATELTMVEICCQDLVSCALVSRVIQSEYACIAVPLGLYSWPDLANILVTRDCLYLPLYTHYL